MVNKALQYTNDQNANVSGSKFVIICEVALGKIKEMRN